jgi:(p)ppGpp synthase/HD superfamily hydrolase
MSANKPIIRTDSVSLIMGFSLSISYYRSIIMKTDVELLQDAIDFARPFHEATVPGYFDDHVMAVVREVQKHTNDMNVIRAAVCHDLLEDTACTGPELLAALGYAVYWMAESLTDEPGKNRQERKWKTYHKIRRSRMIVLVKLCDRLDNLRRCLRDPKVKYSQMYLKEDVRRFGIVLSGLTFGLSISTTLN